MEEKGRYRIQEEKREIRETGPDAGNQAGTESPAGGGPKAAPENRMGTEPVRGLLLKMSVPLMISMLVQAMYNIVDSFFVAKLSEDAFTAVSMCFPIQSLMFSFGIGTAVGMSALISRYLGARQHDRVTKVATNGFFLSWCTYLMFAIIGSFSRSFIAVQLSDPVKDAAIVDYGGTYLQIVCWLSIMLFTQVFIERLLQSTGKTFYIFLVQGSGAVINCIMDPILIFGLFGFPKLGVAGAAIATVFGQAFGAGLGLYFNIRKNKEIRVTFRGFRPSLRVIRDIYRIGLPSIIMQSIGSVMVFGLNQILFGFSNTAVATFGAYFKLQSFVFMPIFGMNNGLVPIIAYNYGARKPERMRQAMSISARYAVAFMAAGMLIFWLIPGLLLGIFSASDEMLRIGIPALRIISVGFPVAGYAIMRGSVFQALGKSTYSMNISIVRQLVILLPAAYLLAKLGSVTYVWIAFPLAEFIAVILSIFYTQKIRREIIDVI